MDRKLKICNKSSVRRTLYSNNKKDYIHPCLCNVIPSLRFQNPRGQMCSIQSPSLSSHFLLIYHIFDIKVIHQRMQITCSHTSRCHYCNVDFVLFHNFTCYTNSQLSCIYVTNTHLLNITCTLIATNHDSKEVRVCVCIHPSSYATCHPYTMVETDRNPTWKLHTDTTLIIPTTVCYS